MTSAAPVHAEQSLVKPPCCCRYGAYGVPIDASFGSNRLSLLDRGFVWAIAHIRGGGDMGRMWCDANPTAPLLSGHAPCS
jgi:protease II